MPLFATLRQEFLHETTHRLVGKEYHALVVCDVACTQAILDQVGMSFKFSKLSCAFWGALLDKPEERVMLLPQYRLSFMEEFHSVCARK